MSIHTTWMLLRRGDEVLLGLKKRGFGKGRMNGVGGKVEPDESIEAAAIRETQEEIGVKVTKMEKVVEIAFDNLYYKGTPERNVMYGFIATEWEGEPIETDEIKPEWVKISDLDYDKMWVDDRHWLPQVLAGKKIQAWFHFNEDDTFDDYWVDEIDDTLIDNIEDGDVGLPPASGDVASYKYKTSARAVLFDEDGKVALIHSLNRGWYKLPGGGHENDELRRENLQREVLEETGYKIKNVRPIGICRNTRHNWQMTAEAWIYLCETDEFIGKEPMEDEVEDGDTLEWFNSIDDALEALKSVKLDEIGFYGAYFFTKREIDTLEYAKRFIRE